jgi:hypothetical protein
MANCDPNDQKHDISGGILGEGCTKEAAELALIDALLSKAEEERKKKCDKLTCETNDKQFECTTRLELPDGWEKKIEYLPIRLKDCPSGVGWQAVYQSDKKYHSRCICIKRRKVESSPPREPGTTRPRARRS